MAASVHFRVMTMKRKFLAVAALVLASPFISAQTFVDVSEASGAGAYPAARGMGSGVAAADYDRDGDIDLFLPTAEDLPHQLLRNNGRGRWTDVAATVGLDDPARGRTALWLDWNHDGRLDLLVGSDCFDHNCYRDEPLITFYQQNQDGTFSDVTESTGISELPTVHGNSQHRAGFNAFDYDRDGDLDILSLFWFGTPHLYRNNGDGTFTDVADGAGLTPFSGVGFWHAMPYDFDGDGWTDVFVGVDFTENFLWRNNGDGTFIDVATEAGVDSAQNEMGAAFGDYDNDGDFDFYVTNIYAFYEPSDRNTLYRNDSTAAEIRFTEVSGPMGVADGAWGWGTTFFDYDLDGWLDLAATNGFMGDPWSTDTTRLFHNLNGGGFSDVSIGSGVADSDWGHTIIAADMDGDGDPDLIQTAGTGPGQGYLRVLENRTDTGNYLIVAPQDPQNLSLAGTTIQIQTAAGNQQRLLVPGTSFLGQEPDQALFGLGTAEMVDQVRITWPDGRVRTLRNVTANQRLTVSPESAGIVTTYRVVPVMSPIAYLLMVLLLKSWLNVTTSAAGVLRSLTRASSYSNL